MNPIRVWIADDEAAARRGLRALLAADAEIEVVGESASGRETCEAVRELAPDLLFLDIRMPDMDGFEVLAALDAGELPVVVFVTAFDEYTLQAFEVQALDYVLKPFTDERFARALSRAKEQCHSRRRAASRPATGPGQPYVRRLAVGSRDDVRFLDVAGVRWIEADGYRVRVHCSGGAGNRAITLRGNIGSFEKRLDPAEFFRVSRSALVNLSHVRGLRTHFHDRPIALLNDGTEIPVSRARRTALLSLLERTRS